MKFQTRLRPPGRILRFMSEQEKELTKSIRGNIIWDISKEEWEKREREREGVNKSKATGATGALVVHYIDPCQRTVAREHLPQVPLCSVQAQAKHPQTCAGVRVRLERAAGAEARTPPAVWEVFVEEALTANSIFPSSLTSRVRMSSSSTAIVLFRTLTYRRLSSRICSRSSALL
ncbi:hypothetical protein EYF80_017619 [Liparis tanakae]|uniref:Uncharacterized protein n=1 Tax=Liparis tanakae TaxID=230148 RepID=A0A4Z2I344_9TELE|nr:hypothetical protein EYF80_017619 [Liparis tanakae]